MEVDELLAKAKGLPEWQQRRVAAILGSLVADAAAQPIHWNYDDVVLQKVLANADNPEFISPSANVYYCIPTGNQSPYGDQLLTMLESIVACKGFNAAASALHMFKVFGPGSPYDNQAPSLYSKGMKDKSMYPINGRWQSFVLRRFSECYAAGKSVDDLTDEDNNLDPDNIPRLVPLVALYAGKPEFLELVEEAATQLQTSDMIVTIVLASCRIMEQYMLQTRGDPVKDVIQELKSPGRAHPQSLDRAVAVHLQTAVESLDQSVFEVTRKFGKA